MQTGSGQSESFSNSIDLISSCVAAYWRLSGIQMHLHWFPIIYVAQYSLKNHYKLKIIITSKNTITDLSNVIYLQENHVDSPNVFYFLSAFDSINKLSTVAFYNCIEKAKWSNFASMMQSWLGWLMSTPWILTKALLNRVWLYATSPSLVMGVKGLYQQRFTEPINANPFLNLCG